MSRRLIPALGVGLLVLAVAIGGVRTLQGAASHCGTSVTSRPADRSRTPFLDEAGRREQPDVDRDRAIASLTASPGVLGPVVGAVGYHYEQWAQLDAFTQGIGVRTRNNPDFTMLDDSTLRPMWSVQVDTARSTYDAGDRTYLVATLPAHGSPDLVALDADTGRRQWCRRLAVGAVGDDAPFATQMVDGGSRSRADGVVVLTPSGARGMRVTSVDGTGRSRWTRHLAADRGDYLGSLTEGRLVVGGRSAPELLDPQATRPATTAVRALDVRDGATLWRYDVPEGTAVHVVGTSGATVVLDRHDGDRDPSLVGLDAEGQPAWTVAPGLGPAVDATVRSGRVLVRGTNRWAAYDASTGHLLWRLRVPQRPQLLPYGFSLATVPLLDDDHALIGTTRGLQVLDLTRGRLTETSVLPTDGVNTTFWPYQVVVSPRLVAVATNTSALLIRREPTGQ